MKAAGVGKRGNRMSDNTGASGFGTGPHQQPPGPPQWGQPGYHHTGQQPPVGYPTGQQPVQARTGPDGRPIGQTGPPIGQRDEAFWDSLTTRPPRRQLSRLPLLVGGGVLALAVVAAGTWFTLDVFTGGAGGEAADQGRSLVVPPHPAGAGDALDLDAVASRGSVVVAVGRDSVGGRTRPVFLVSTDAGASWKLADQQGPNNAPAALGDSVRSVVASEFGWLAVGSGPRGVAVWTSPDGAVWTRRPDQGPSFRATDALVGAVRTRDGYLLAGNHGDSHRAVFWLSTDGSSWLRLKNSDTGPFYAGDGSRVESIAGHGNAVVVAGSVGRTADGRSGRSTGLWRSTDGGRGWNEVILAPELHTRVLGSRLAGVVSTGKELVAVGGGKGSYTTISSVDGDAWKAGPSTQLQISGQPSELGDLRATGSRLVTIASIRGSDLLATAGADGVNWTSAPLAGDLTSRQSELHIEGVAAAEDGAIAVGYLTEGEGRSKRRVAALYRLRGDGPLERVDLDKVADLTSAAVTVRSSAADGATLLAVGSANGDPAVWRSEGEDAGRTWTAVTSPAFGQEPGEQELVGIARGKLGWLAVGVDRRDGVRPVLLTSADGQSWTPLSGSDQPFPSRENGAGWVAPTAVTAGNFGYVVTAVVERDGYTSTGAWYTVDLRRWYAGEPGAPTVSGANDLTGVRGVSRAIQDVAFNPRGFVAVGAADDAEAPARSRRRPGVWMSANGTRWQLRQVPLPAGADRAELRAVATSGNRIVAVGTALRPDAGEERGFAFSAVSEDNGEHWQTLPLPAVGSGEAPSGATALTRTRTGYLAVGASGLEGEADTASWTSTDGRSWRPVPAEDPALTGPGDQRFTAVLERADSALAFGYSADVRGSVPTLWTTAAG